MSKPTKPKGGDGASLTRVAWLKVYEADVPKVEAAVPGCRVLDGYGRSLVDELEQARDENERLRRLKAPYGVPFFEGLAVTLLGCAAALLALPLRDWAFFAAGACSSFALFAVLVPLLGGKK